jgi:hypothetical protein
MEMNSVMDNEKESRNYKRKLNSSEINEFSDYSDYM